MRQLAGRRDTERRLVLNRVWLFGHDDRRSPSGWQHLLTIVSQIVRILACYAAHLLRVCIRHLTRRNPPEYVRSRQNGISLGIERNGQVLIARTAVPGARSSPKIGHARAGRKGRRSESDGADGPARSVGSTIVSHCATDTQLPRANHLMASSYSEIFSSYATPSHGPR